MSCVPYPEDQRQRGLGVGTGKGSQIIIKLPLTIAIIQALMVEVERSIFAIPLSTMIEAVRISKRYQDDQRTGSVALARSRPAAYSLGAGV
ncbi:MAG: hypothetical protein MRJ92_05910 [Nitrospira sp.]|nr:hypothetical protein [Nitrospira sp.]